MAAFLALFAAFVVLAAPAAVHHVDGHQLDGDFLSIDCGLPADQVQYTDDATKVIYVPDDKYVDGGVNLRVAAEYAPRLARRYQTVRSFPEGAQNCYALPTAAGARYLVRLEAVYGNHDGRNVSSLQFDLRLGTNDWCTVSIGAAAPAGAATAYEAVFVAWAGWAPVCLVNTGGGTPFVSVLELRRLDELYPLAAANQSMYMYKRINAGDQDSLTRYPDDLYDRFWSPMEKTSPQWTNQSITSSIKSDTDFAVPSSILQTAVVAVSNTTSTSVMTWQDSRNNNFMVFLHFADFQNTQARSFDIYLNEKRLSTKPYSPLYLQASCVYNTEWYRAPDGNYNITLVPTATTMLPPMLNAIEIYTLIYMDDSPSTLPEDFNTIMGIKFFYGVKKKWTGDPCFPEWDGVKCSNASDNHLRITSLDLSSCGLSGEISQNFTFLTALENLDLSNNSLKGPIPDSLSSLRSLRVLKLSGNHLNRPFPEFICKNYTGLLVSYEDGPICDETNNPTRSRTTVIAVSVVIPGAVVAAILAYLTWRLKQKRNGSTHGPAKDEQLDNASQSAKNKGDSLHASDNRRFTYKELEMFTNNFRRFIGRGGFGPVYYGCLEDGTEVAVKKLSESSSHGLEEFLAEVQNLTKVHHKNLVSLVGYCWEDNHLALVYEYMSQGSLYDHLRGKNGGSETLMNWETRIRVVLEAAQGLDYLHKGCTLPIIHRDVKTSNILLGKNLEAKIADFGLSRSYLSDSQTHISATAAGSAGYIDPEYYYTGRLTDSSDVFSFGVVLLEMATGKPPIVSGHGHIIQYVNKMVTAGDDISLIADVRLGGSYDVSSMWKVVDTAMMCTADVAAQRPTMATVVAQLKESLALEEAREKDSSVGADMSALLSTIGPSAR